MWSVKWKHLNTFHQIQEGHGLRLGNKLSGRHIDFQKNKMKVKLALEAIASNSVAKSLEWAYANQIPELCDEDVLVTAKFLKEFKAALSLLNYEKVSEHFCSFTAMYEALETTSGQKIIHSRRKSGPLGFLTYINSIKRLMADITCGTLKLDYLCTYKLQKDHLEQFFGAQFRYAFRKLLIHAGKSILSGSTGNCLPQDETVLLSISTRPIDLHQSEQTFLPINESVSEIQNQPIHEKGCSIQSCRVCTAAITYIAGYYVYSLEKQIKCKVCRSSLMNSTEDPCENFSLIQFKNYVPKHSGMGLKYPSGSLCRLLYICEKTFRQNSKQWHPRTSSKCF
eukprot:TCALIF_09951-PA protein Name:"Similar to THAP9 DNA transposase THAP9 (Homo sapiens)" AED:0.28 eAED:0.29 QI:0/0/0/0.75/0/0/4/0/337